MTGWLLLVAGALGQEPATVGDTIWVETIARVPARMIVRPQVWELGDLGQTLGAAQVHFSADSVRIRYPVVIWHPGDHLVQVPGPIVVTPEGHSDTLPPVSTRIRVLSVLPVDSSRETLAPRPAAQPVAQASRSLLPVLVLEAMAIGVALIAYLSWKRRSDRRRAGVPEPVASPLDMTRFLERWARTGERRTALDGWARQLEEAGDGRDAAETAAWLEAAERAGFQSREDVAELERLLATVPARNPPAPVTRSSAVAVPRDGERR